MATFLSHIVGKPVWDAKGERLGRCTDVLVTEVETGFPYMRAIALSNDKQSRLIGAKSVAWLTPSIILNTNDPPAYEERGDELWLVRQVLDQQIVDTEGRRLVRVNDIQLTRVASNGVRFRVAGVDVGTLSLLRRLGIEGLAEGVFRLLKREPPRAVIPWTDVAPLQSDAPIRLRISRDKISELHPADIADIIEELDRPLGQALLQTLNNETIADTMEEIHPELQASLLGN